jgi:NodT family efflux transporter outer membrane factor (OMF) lipoprotein
MSRAPTRMPAPIALAAAALLSACASTPPAGPAPMMLPAGFVESAPAGGAVDMPRPDWWTAFGDPTLDALEKSVVVSNADLARALAQLRRARADVDLRRAAASPSLSADVAADRTHTSADVAGRALAGRTVDDHAAGLEASWEPDLFGRVADQVAAARGDAEATAADVASLRLALQADVAKDYLSMRSIADEQALLARSQADQQALLTLTRERLDDGTASELEVAQSQGELEALEARRIDLDTQRATLRHALATLTGQPAATLLLPAAATPSAPPAVAAGVPSDLLRRRPDIDAAAQRVAAANARAGVARLAWFPSLVISLAGGFESTALGPFLSLPSRAWSLGPALALPLFDGGRRKADLSGAEADVDAAAAAYRGTVIAAINDVEDQLATLSTLQQEDVHQAQAVHWSMRAAEVAERRYQAGVDAYADVLLARQASLSTQRDELLLKRRQLLASVELVRALGGGWEAPAHATTSGSVDAANS